MCRHKSPRLAHTKRSLSGLWPGKGLWYLPRINEIRRPPESDENAHGRRGICLLTMSLEGELRNEFRSHDSFDKGGESHCSVLLT